MHLRERLQSGAGPSLSFEFFPPKNEQAAAALYQTIRELEPYHPSFVSVTYGAGGSTRELTREVVLRIQHESRIPTVPHLTCVGHSREEVWSILDQYAQAGVRAVLALRGDPRAARKITTVMRMPSAMRRNWWLLFVNITNPDAIRTRTGSP